jgi:hypothetical protein
MEQVSEEEEEQFRISCLELLFLMNLILLVNLKSKSSDLLFTDSISFYSFCKVGSGYSDSELKVLQKMLEKHWHVYKTTNPPPWLHLVEPFKEKPDVWIYPKE